MAEIGAFRGLRYALPPAELGAVLAPPYDVISPELRDTLYARDARNIVRVVLNRSPGESAYSEAAAHYTRWRQQGILQSDATASLYVLEQRFEGPAGQALRLGLLARFKAEPAGSGSILPHEHTRPAAKEDRYRLLVATRANFSPIFLMTADPQGRLAALLAQAAQGTPVAGYTDDEGVAHRLWRIDDLGSIDAFRAQLGRERSYIADGHHRYATALRFGEQPDGTALTCGYFTPLESPGLLVLPYHRILSAAPDLHEVARRLAGTFELREVRGTAEAAAAAAGSSAPYAFGFVQPGAGGLLAEARPEAAGHLLRDTPPSLRVLDTYCLHHAVLGPLLGIGDEAVSYVHSLGAAEQAVTAGHCRLAVLLRATPVRHIVAVAEARTSMPAKSTFFHPKLPSGLVIHPLDD